MMGRAYCPECKKHVEIEVEKKLVKEYKGVQVNVEEHIPHCSECGTELFVPDIENENLKRLYQRYRELTGLITPEEIQKIREKYGLSQRELGQILGWGKMTINRYERGALPSKSHSDILKLILTSEGFFKEKVEEAWVWEVCGKTVHREEGQTSTNRTGNNHSSEEIAGVQSR